jgi:hypothetical protein
MTGPIVAVAGTVDRPGVAIGREDTGLARVGGALIVAHNGAMVAQFMAASTMFVTPINAATNRITMLGEPTAPTDAASKSYVDSAISAALAPILAALKER